MPKSRKVSLALAIAMMAIVAYYDAKTSNQVSLWAFYIPPVVLISWRFEFLEGAVAACMAGVLIMISSVFSGFPYATSWGFLFATLCKVSALVTLAWFASRLAATQSLLEKVLSGAKSQER